jgi:hypothetical protein
MRTASDDPSTSPRFIRGFVVEAEVEVDAGVGRDGEFIVDLCCSRVLDAAHGGVAVCGVEGYRAAGLGIAGCSGDDAGIGLGKGGMGVEGEK